MGLKIWLPLYKDINNQGTQKLNFTNSGATYQTTGGKFGGCYTFDGVDDRIWASGLNISGDAISVCCWFKRDSSYTAEGYILSLNNGSGYADCEIGIDSDASNIIGVAGGINVSYGCTHGIWHHITVTFDKQNIKVYIDGVFLGATTNTNSLTKPYLTIGARANGGNGSVGIAYPFKGQIQDVRLYDYCLSESEIKQIAQGLVVHYLLNRQGWGQENLASQYVMPGGNSPGTTSTAGRTNYYGDYGIIIPATENADTYFSIWYPEPLESGVVYTLSAEVSGLLEGSYYNFPLFAQNNTSMGIIQFNHNGLNKLTFTMNYTGTITTATVGGKTYYRMFMDDNGRAIASGQGAITIKNIKLEKGSIATPWCPNSSDALATAMNLNSTIEYDGSGFQNNGIRNGNFTWDTDTAILYDVSTRFLGNNTSSGVAIYYHDISIPNDTFTFGGWFKIISSVGGGSAEYIICLNNNSYSGDIQFCLLHRNNTLSVIVNTTEYSVRSLSLDTWYHVMVSYDGTNAKTYINGVLANTTTVSNRYIANNLILGARSSSVNGTTQQYYSNVKMQDMRVYVTALSEKDIKSLYQNSAYIDDNNIIYGKIR